MKKNHKNFATMGKAVLFGLVVMGFGNTVCAQGPAKKPTPPPASPIVIDTNFVVQQKMQGHSNYAKAMAYSPDGKFLVTAAWDTKVNVYALDSNTGVGPVVRTFDGFKSLVNSLAFSKDGKMLGMGSKDFSFRVNNIETGDVVFQTQDHKDAITSVKFEPAGKYAYTSSLDGTLRMYDVAQPLNNLKPKFIDYGKPINDFLLSSGTKQLYVVASSGSDIEVIDFAKTLIRSYKGHTAGVTCLDISANKKMMASGSLDKTVIVWDVATGAIIKKFEGHTWKVNSVNFSKDGKYVVSACNDGETRVWEIATGNCVAILKSFITNAQQAQFSPNGKRIAVVGAMEAQGNNYGAVIYKTPEMKPKVAAGKGGVSGTTGTGTGTGKPGSGSSGVNTPANTTPVTPKRTVTKYEGDVWPPPAPKKKK